MKENKYTAKELKEKLFINRKNGVMSVSEEEIVEADKFGEPYKEFLNAAKTEREAFAYFLDMAQKRGFVEFDPSAKYSQGQKVFYSNRNKALILAVIGKNSVSNGVRITASHIDSPRLDLKPNPLYEDSDLALLKTHYYGGIKKYQWIAIPLSLHGVIFKKDGGAVRVSVGEDPGDPQFCITDILPHLAEAQMKQPISKAFKGEDMSILVGSRPFRDDKESELVKLNIMSILNEKYGIEERDFISAELEITPAMKAVDIGFDRSMIGGYGHDDRVCAYAAAMSSLECENPEYTTMTVLADKEEIGSYGNTGLASSFMEYFIADLGRMSGVEARDILRKSVCLSADVNAAFDPLYPDVMDKKNAALINGGVCVTKYTGSRGKSGTSDASAEFTDRICKTLDKNNVLWQTGELGKVDVGGGGTVALYIAQLDVDVIDIGVPVLSMHSPFEVISKLDLYMCYKAVSAFYNAQEI